MTKLACLNMKCSRDLGKATRLLRNLLFSVDVAAIEKYCLATSVYSSYEYRQARGVSLLVKRTLSTQGSG